MQSGLNNTKKWCLEPLSITPKKKNSVFSWISVNGTQDQIKIFFTVNILFISGSGKTISIKLKLNGLDFVSIENFG